MRTTHISRDRAHTVLVVRGAYPGESIYIGRPFRGEPGSVLANPRSLRDGWAREEVLEHYARELDAALDRTVDAALWNGRALNDAAREAMRAEMNRLYRTLRDEGVIALRCFCAPLSCHGDVIARRLIAALERRPPAAGARVRGAQTT